MSELKPCPFCGKKPNPDWTDESYIECTNRKCSVCGYGMSTGNWNNRPIEDALTARITELEAAQRWIPVSEPPKVSGKYLLLNIYEDVYSCDFIADTNTWVLSEYDSITHWMPLPKLPEVQE